MSIKKGNLIPFIFVAVLGTLLHFTYDWSGQNPIVGIFSAQNESTWEHLKLFFFPMLFLTLIQVFFNNTQEDFIQRRTIGIVSGMLFIIVVFYTTWGIFGKLVDWWNITIYYLSLIFAFWIESKSQEKAKRMAPYTALAILFVITFAFVMFSFNSPDVGIFYDLSLHPKG